MCSQCQAPYALIGVTAMTVYARIFGKANRCPSRRKLRRIVRYVSIRLPHSSTQSTTHAKGAVLASHWRGKQCERSGTVCTADGGLKAGTILCSNHDDTVKDRGRLLFPLIKLLSSKPPQNYKQRLASVWATLPCATFLRCQACDEVIGQATYQDLIPSFRITENIVC